MAFTNILINPDRAEDQIKPFLFNDIYLESNLDHYFPKVDLYIEKMNYQE